MPVEKTTDIDLGADEKTFDDLDKSAQKAIKALEQRDKELKKSIKTAESAEREQKRLESRGGIFQNLESNTSLPSGKAPRDLAALSKEDEKFEKNIRKIQEKIKKDEIAQFGNKSSFLEEILGKQKAENIFNLVKNPVSFLTGIAKAIPFLGGVFAAKEIADFIVDELVKIDAFFKKFVDEAERRTDLVRSRIEQANISAGLTQKIITTASGGADPRTSYNTFQIFNDNQAELEGNFSISNNHGVR